MVATNALDPRKPYTRAGLDKLLSESLTSCGLSADDTKSILGDMSPGEKKAHVQALRESGRTRELPVVLTRTCAPMLTFSQEHLITPPKECEEQGEERIVSRAERSAPLRSSIRAHQDKKRCQGPALGSPEVMCIQEYAPVGYPLRNRAEVQGSFGPIQEAH